MSSVKVTVHGEKELIAEFDLAAERVPDEMKKVGARGANNVKRDWRAAWKGIRHAPRIGLSISYDEETTDTGFSWDIGPVDEPNLQGFLGGIIELGGIHNGPRPGGLPALEREAPKFEAAAVAVIDKLFP